MSLQTIFSSFKKTLLKFNSFVCDSKKAKIWNLSLFVSLIIYFILTTSAYAEWFPGSTKYFSFNTTSGMVIRGLASALVILSCFFCFVAYRKQINSKWLYVFIFMIIISFIMIFVTQTSYETLYRTTKLYDFMAVYKTSVSFKTNFTMYISFVLDIVFGFCFVFIIPKSLKNNWYYIMLISLFLLIMFYSCCYSFFKERDYYIYFMHGDWHYEAESIGSIFGNKQQWGVFLAPAFVCAFIDIYLIFKTKLNKWIKLVGILGLFAIGCCCFFCGLVAFCKTAIVADVLFVGVLIIGSIICLFYKKRVLFGSIITAIICVGALAFTLIMVVPSLHQSGFGKKIFDIVNTLIQRGEVGAESRFELLRAVMENFPGVNLMFGMPKGTLDPFTRSLIPEMVNGLHSGIVIYFGRTGIFGLIVYVGLLILIFLKALSFFKKKPLFVFMFVAALASSIILNLGELEILIMSSSATVFMYNVVCVMLPLSETSVNILQKNNNIEVAANAI